ncbi:MAG: tRNA threonylcarbamoyladenosine biosynthesis protein TsaB [Solirubrobacteraceae bacterium]|nr:tRNA threonylcarbamoyladenosine biosynthesis protein TsaB [Solirubrobacteraceae bacterium]
MRILAFDTATRATAVAVCDTLELPGAGTREARDDPPPGQRPGHMTHLMPLIVELLDEAGWSWADIDRIAVGRGPGTFTGLRIGVSTARALARSLACPLVAVSTLHSLALNVDRAAPDAEPDAVVAVLDARRREAFAAAWSLEPAAQGPGQSTLGRQLLAPRALAPKDLAAILPGLGKRPLVLGEGAVEFREILVSAGALTPGDASDAHRVTAVNHCRLAEGAPGATPDEVRPEYLRLPDAEIAHRAAGPR